MDRNAAAGDGRIVIRQVISDIHLRAPSYPFDHMSKHPCTMPPHDGGLTTQAHRLRSTVGVSGAPPVQHTIMGALAMICENAKEVHRVAVTSNC